MDPNVIEALLDPANLERIIEDAEAHPDDALKQEAAGHCRALLDAPDTPEAEGHLVALVEIAGRSVLAILEQVGDTLETLQRESLRERFGGNDLEGKA